MLDHGWKVDQFRIDTGSVGCLLVGGIWVQVDVHGLSLFGLVRRSSARERQVLADLAVAIVSKLDARPTSISFDFQHLVPWDTGDVIEAYGRAADNVLDRLASTLRIKDFSLLVDGERESGDAKYQAEWGIVSADEAPARVARMAGRTSGVKPDAHEQILKRTYPDVATFVDSWWSTMSSPADDDLSTWVYEEMTTAEAEADSLTRFVHAQAVGLARSGEGTSS